MFIQNGAAGLARRRRRYRKKGNPLPVYKNRAGLSVVLVTGLPARMVREVFRTEEVSERRRAHSVDHAGFEVEEIRARYVHAARPTPSGKTR